MLWVDRGGCTGGLRLALLRFADTPLPGIAADASVVVERGDNLGKVLNKLRAQRIEIGAGVYWQVLARQTGAAGNCRWANMRWPPTPPAQPAIGDARWQGDPSQLHDCGGLDYARSARRAAVKSRC